MKSHVEKCFFFPCVLFCRGVQSPIKLVLVKLACTRLPVGRDEQNGPNRLTLCSMNSNPLGIKRFVSRISVSFKFECHIIMRIQQKEFYPRDILSGYDIELGI